MAIKRTKSVKPVFYILTDPKKTSLASTIGPTRDHCWEMGFWVVAEALGEDWRKKYWKRWEASIAAAERAGYTIRKAHLTLIPKRAASRDKKKVARKRVDRLSQWHGPRGEPGKAFTGYGTATLEAPLP